MLDQIRRLHERQYMALPQNLILSTSEEAARQHAIAKTIATGVPPVFRQAALSRRHWLCVGVEDELERRAVERLAEACAAAGYTLGWSVEIPWSQDKHIVAANRLSLTSPAIRALAKDICLGSCYLLVEECENFAVVSDGDLYWMLAGRRGFVEAVIGTTVERQLEAFGELARSYKQPGSLAGVRLATVHDAAAAAYEAEVRL